MIARVEHDCKPSKLSALPIVIMEFIDGDGNGTICPKCLELLSGLGTLCFPVLRFQQRLSQ